MLGYAWVICKYWCFWWCWCVKVKKEKWERIKERRTAYEKRVSDRDFVIENLIFRPLRFDYRHILLVYCLG